MEDNKTLSDSIPHFPEEYLKKYYRFYLIKGVFEHDSHITKDLNFTIKPYCEDVHDKGICNNFTGCMWVGKECEEKSWLVPVIAVCSIAVLACLGAAAFVVVNKFFFTKPPKPDHFLPPPLIIPINGVKRALTLDEDEIGHGRFGRVYHAEDKYDNSQYAVKIIQITSAHDKDQVKKEVKVMKGLDKQYVVAFYGSRFDKTTVSIAMEYFPMGSLENVLKDNKLPSNARVPILLDIAKAMAYLHSQNIIHRDLKPGNVLVSSIDYHKHPMAKFVSFSFIDKKTD